MKWLRLSFAALVVLVATLAAAWLPPAREPLALTSAIPQAVRGAIHVHTRRSDGTGSLDDVAAAAARAGLKFVIVTDHGDGTRRPERPSYRAGVLVIDAVEISSESGHVVALGLGQAPYPLGGEGRDVIDDIARLGGMSIVAHPGSAKPELQWVEWSAPFDGLEWLNGDSEWRDEPSLALLRTLLTYPLRPVETLARVLDRPDVVMQRWDALTKRRRVVAVAAGDAHARLALGSAPDPYGESAVLRIPAYERVFSAFSIGIPQLRLSGSADEDAARLIDEIRRGHVFSSIDALASPAAVSFTARSGSQQAGGGDVLGIDGEVAVRVATNAPGNSTITLLKDGQPVASSTRATLEFSGPPSPAVYRAEIALNHAPGTPPVPWIVTNPIYIGRPEQPAEAPSRGAAQAFASVYGDGPVSAWQIEANADSRGAVDAAPAEGGGTQLRWRYALGGTQSDSPYVALVTAAGPALPGYDRVSFAIRADRPMRVSLQLRVPRGSDGERWQRSVYVDEQRRDVTVFFDDMKPAGFTTTRRPLLSGVQSLMWVVGAPNTLPGTSGQVWLDDVRYGR